MKSETTTIRSSLEWNAAVDAFAASVGMTKTSLLAEGVRLLATLHGRSLPPRVSQPAPHLGPEKTLDFSTLDVERLKN